MGGRCELRPAIPRPADHQGMARGGIKDAQTFLIALDPSCRLNHLPFAGGYWVVLPAVQADP